jgi:PP-loop superfamily ATP-utilizing enzyme
MDMIQYSNTGEYRQTPDARLKAELSEVEQILLEVELTDQLQKQLDRCNLCLKNFKLRLIMEED